MQHDNTLIGETHTEYYLRKFARFDRNDGRYFPTWNWAAFLFMGVWSLYRRMTANFWKFVLIFGPLSFLEEIIGEEGIFLVMWLVSAVFYGLAGDYFYYRHVRRLGVDEAQAASADGLSEKGGVLGWVPYVFGTLGVLGLIGVGVWSTMDYVEKSEHRSGLYQTRGGREP